MRWCVMGGVMSVCRGARDLTFQYPCSCGFRLPAGGTERVRHAPFPLAKQGEPTPVRFPSRCGGNLQEGGKNGILGSPHAVAYTPKGRNSGTVRVGFCVLRCRCSRSLGWCVLPTVPAVRCGCSSPAARGDRLPDRARPHRAPSGCRPPCNARRHRRGFGAA